MANIEQARPRLRELKARGDAIKAQIEMLHHEFSLLNTRLSDLGNRKRVTDREFDAILIDSAQRDCHKFLTAFHAKLPREIRDMCYEYACTEEHPIVIWTQHPPKSLSEGPPFYIRKLQTEAGLSKAAPRTPEEASFVRDTTVAHPSTYLLNPDFCGPQVNMETREIFFGHNTWDACVLPSGDWLDPSWTSPRQLWTFFSDQFHDYFLRRDGTQLPRRMRLHVCWDLGKEQALHGASPAVCKAYMWRLHASLTELTNLQRKDLLHVEFVLHTALDLGPQTFTYNPQPWSLRKDRDFALLLAVLEDAVYAIKHAGGSVAVRHYNVAVDVVDSDVNIEDDGLDSGVRPTVLFQDLTQSFRMDEREWRQQRGERWSEDTAFIPDLLFPQDRAAYLEMVPRRWHVERTLDGLKEGRAG